jgi:hypothetical protein
MMIDEKVREPGQMPAFGVEVDKREIYEPNEWITPADAMARLTTIMDEAEAQRVIMTRASYGLVKAKADRLVKDLGPTNLATYRGRNRSGELLRPFYWAKCSEDCSPDQNWTTGDFSASFEGIPWLAFGVTFLKVDIEHIIADVDRSAVAGNDNGSAQQKTRKKAKGRPRKKEWDDWIVVAIFDICDEGFPEQGSFRAELRRRINGKLVERGLDELSETSLRSTLKKIEEYHAEWVETATPQ